MGHEDPEWKALEALVDNFAEAMKVKLQQKMREGRSGWDDPDWLLTQVREQLRIHADFPTKPEDFVDIANFAAFAWNKLP